MALSIRTLVTSAVVALLLLATAAVGLNAYVSTRRALEESWFRTADSLAALAAKQTAVFLADAAPAAVHAEGLVDDGRLDPSDYDAVLDHGVRVLRTHTHHTWFSWSDEAGTLASVLWWPGEEGPRIRKDLRVLVDGRSWQRMWEDQGGEWVLVDEQWTDYDPRRRSYYQAGAALTDGGRWVDPYLFESREQPGISYVLPSRDAQGTLRGVWSSDFECGPLSTFVAGLDVGNSGRAYLLDHEGRVVGHPNGEVAGADQVLYASEHSDPWLVAAWDAYVAGGSAPGAFAVGELLAAARPFAGTADAVPFTVLVVVPRAELYGPAMEQVERTVLVTVVVLVVALWVGVVFSRRLAVAIAAVEREMDQIARFELTATQLAGRPTVFREVHGMSLAHDRMKQGLRSFSRYVPRQLVAELMRSGTEARVGGDEREITVVFCDIIGFTSASEITAPDVMLAALSDYLTEMSAIVQQHQGVVVQYLGDAIIAIWGAPVQDPDHAAHGVAAGVAMRDRSRQLERLATGRGFPVLPTRIGIHTGRCIVGNIGSRDRFSYTVLGEGLRKAEWVQEQNRVHGSGLLISDATAAAVGEGSLQPVDGAEGLFEPRSAG